MIRGTFQCWGTANDLIGHTDIEGCGAGGGVQGLALAWDAQTEWRVAQASSPASSGGVSPPTSNLAQELCINLLFNRRIHAQAKSPLTHATPIAAELWSYLPYEGRLILIVHQTIPRLLFRLPDGVDPKSVRLRYPAQESTHMVPLSPDFDGPYAVAKNLQSGEALELTFPLNEYQTTETVQGKPYKIQWRGSSVLAIDPKGTNMPLYAHRQHLRTSPAPLSAPRYP